jgi:hypothetical protein
MYGRHVRYLEDACSAHVARSTCGVGSATLLSIWLAMLQTDVNLICLPGNAVDFGYSYVPG